MNMYGMLLVSHWIGKWLKTSTGETSEANMQTLLLAIALNIDLHLALKASKLIVEHFKHQRGYKEW